jgi:pullulanase
MFLLLAQGIPFIHSGQELARTKGLEHNSYNLPDKVNMFDWNSKNDSHIKEIFEFTKSLITLRKKHPCFNLKDKENIQKKISFLNPGKKLRSQGIICVEIDCAEIKSETWNKALVVFNPSFSKHELIMPEGNWRSEIINSHFFVKTRKNIKQVKEQKNAQATEKIILLPVSGQLLYISK